jgi:hypothetical protein
MDWIHLAQVECHWRAAALNATMIIRIP